MKMEDNRHLLSGCGGGDSNKSSSKYSDWNKVLHKDPWFSADLSSPAGSWGQV